MASLKPKRRTSVAAAAWLLVALAGPALAQEKPPSKTPVEIEFAGRVLDHMGEPVPGAVLSLSFYHWVGKELRTGLDPKAETDKDGTFRFSADPSQFVADAGVNGPSRTFLFATAKGYGAVIRVAPMTDTRVAHQPRDAMEFRLPPDDVPLAGRIIDAEGRPIRGVSVRPVLLNDNQGPKGEPLDLDAAAERPYPFQIGNVSVDHLFAPVETDGDGRFVVRGIGRERVVGLTLAEPKGHSEFIGVATRPKEKRPLAAPQGQFTVKQFYPSVGFTHVMGGK